MTSNHDELERLARAALGGFHETLLAVRDAVDTVDRDFIAAANPATILALLSANRELREEPRVLAITLEGMQGEPAGMMTVGVQMTDGQKFDLIRTNGNAISHWHWARLPDAEARSALTTQRGDGE
jgi:hypothetical protein